MGASAPLAVMWPLSLGWYGDRLAEDYAPKSIDELQALLSRAGLVGDFWQLQ